MAWSAQERALARADAAAQDAFKAESEALRSLTVAQYKFRDEFDGMHHDPITITRMNSPFYEGERWAVRRRGEVLNIKGEWSIESSPSSRDDAFYALFRFANLACAHEAAVSARVGADSTDRADKAEGERV